MRNIYIVILCLFVLLSLFTAFLKFQEARKYKTEISTYFEAAQSIETAFSENVYYDAKNIKLKNNRVVIEDLDTINLQSVFNSKNVKLVLRISDSHCMDCIDNSLMKINKLSKLISNGNIVLLTSYNNINDIIRLRQERKIPFKIYNTTSDILDKELENAGFPYLFLMDSSLVAKSIFIDRIPNSKGEDLYFENIKRYF